MPKRHCGGLYKQTGSMPGSPLGESASPQMGGGATNQYIAVQPAQNQQQQIQASPQRLIQTQSGQQVVFLQDNSNQQRVVMKEQRQPVQQTIQIPASMAGHQLVVAQMPDGRQQIFALQGGSGTQLQMISQGVQQVQHVSQNYKQFSIHR